MTIETTDCGTLRQEIKLVADRLMEVRKRGSPNSEAVANVMLAYRHLEDASMRLGKAIQALDNGVSVYDKTQVPAA
jgi:hypothetical protein